MAYSLQQMLSDVQAIGLGQIVPYITTNQKRGRLDAVDVALGKISFTFINDTKNPSTEESGNFTQETLSQVVDALGAGAPINIDAVLNGGGNKRAVLEAFLSHTQHVFVCYLSGVKHLFWTDVHAHPVGMLCYLAPGFIKNQYAAADQMEADFQQWLLRQPSRGTSGLFGASHATTYCTGLRTCLNDPVFDKVLVKNLFEVQNESCFRILFDTIRKVPGYSQYNKDWNNQAFNAAMGKYLKFLQEKAFSIPVRNGTSEVAEQTLQLIIYGAPGTGKSHKIDRCTNESNSIRVTFHPDTDYAAFVGAYKPTMVGHRKQVILDYENLVDKFKEYLSVQPTNVTRACALFGYDYHDSIRDMTDRGHTIPELVNDAYKSGSTYDSVVRAGMSVYEQSPSETESISYSFVPQAFMKAYIEAWRRWCDASLDSDAKTYYLVIEEINRGNCAQIFGDLFQLLDRADNGFSAYAITPDDDIRKFLEKDAEYKLADIPLADNIKKMTEAGEKVVATAADIKTGKKLVLPPNLCIWATMNTSDQSLFPIDSAFKRRWDWEYVPIAKPDKDGDAAWKERKIKVGESLYDWWDFLTIINKHIAKATESEDKQLGYFFVKAPDDTGYITAERFANKVLFYLYGDVFKSYDLPAAAFKREGGAAWAFRDFFHSESAVVLKANGQFVKDADGKVVKTVSDEATQMLKKPGDVNEFELAAFLDHLKWTDATEEKSVGKANAGTDA